jgi:hypothetical protein
VCYLIHIAVPASQAERVESPRVPRVESHHNPSVSAVLGSSLATFSVTDGGCACSLYSSPDGGANDRDPAESKRRKYERLGWSKAKVARALRTAEEAHSQSRHHTGIRHDVAEIIASLVETTGEVRLFVHHYHGSFAEQRVVSRGTRSMGAYELQSAAHTRIAEDTVYIIRL